LDCPKSSESRRTSQRVILQGSPGCGFGEGGGGEEGLNGASSAMAVDKNAKFASTIEFQLENMI
jgi:hypothetical protein